MADTQQLEKVREILRRRADAYRRLVQTPGWADCLQEMLGYAERATEPAVRCGRLDMIAHMIRAADTAGNILTEETTHAA
jgi:hypothetical protein